MPCSDPILIGSCGSSGSTVLSVMLDAHSEIVSGPELALFAHPFFWQLGGEDWRGRLLRHLDEGYEATFRSEWTLENGFCPYAGLAFENTLPWYGHDRASLAALIARCENGPELAAAIFDPLLASRGKARWAEKSPQNVYAFRAFLEAYPDGRVVYLTRDPRDTVSSLMRKGWGGFKASLAFWLVDTAICETFRGDPRVLPVRYEDLVREPRATVESLVEFLEVAPEVEQLLNFDRTSPRALTPDASSAGDPSWHRRPTEPLGDEAIGTWRTDLSPEQLVCLGAARIVTPLFGYPELSGRTVAALSERLGYEPVNEIPAELESVGRLVEAERLFLSAGDYPSEAVATSHETHVECDPARLPGSEVVWSERLLQAKLAPTRKALAEARGELELVTGRLRVAEDATDRLRAELEAKLDELAARVEALQTEQAELRRHPVVRIVTRLQRLSRPS